MQDGLFNYPIRVNARKTTTDMNCQEKQNDVDTQNAYAFSA